MRTSSIPIFSRGAFFALVSSAALASSGMAQEPTAVDRDTGESTSPFAGALDLSRFALPQDDDDYSVEGLFSQYHGKYMVDRRRFEPNFEAWAGYQDNTSTSSEDAGFSFYEVGGRLEAELPVDPDTFLIYGGLFTVRGYDMELATMVSDEELYQAFLTMGVGRFINEDFLVELRFQPGLASDFDGTLRSDDWDFFGDVIGTYRTNEQLYWKLGVRVDETFDGTDVYPVLGVSFLIDESWRVDILAPRYAELAWMPDPAFIVKAGVSLQGQEYAYRDRVPGATDDENLDWRTQEFRLYGDVAWRLTDQVSFRVRAGATLAGDYEIERVGGLPAYGGQVDPAFFGEVGLGFNF